jgi:hypothetical protein
MSEEQKLDICILETFKIKSTLMDFVKAAYKPVLSTYKPDDKKSEEINIVAEEYNRLVFYMKKIKQLFDALKHSLKELTIDCKVLQSGIPLSSPRDNLVANLEYKTLYSDTDVGKSLEKLFNFKQFKLFLSLSTIPSNTEFHYLGEIDTVDLEKWIDEFDVIFKKYVELVLITYRVGIESCEIDASFHL